MDVSDGLGIDARRMCEASGVGLELDEAELASPELDELSRVCGVIAMDWILGGGEDYELLCAVPAVDGPTFASLAAAAGVAARRIGRFVEAGRGVELLTAGGAVAVGNRGWDPFAAADA